MGYGVGSSATVVFDVIVMLESGRFVQDPRVFRTLIRYIEG
jgi:hypothetical protein